MTGGTRPEACTKLSTHARDLSWSRMGRSQGVGGEERGRETLTREFSESGSGREREK
jgi:hypothetical protein